MTVPTTVSIAAHPSRWSPPAPLWQRTLALFGAIVLLLLPYHWGFDRHSGEIEVLMVARQLVDPTIAPQDWYLNQLPTGAFEWGSAALLSLFGAAGTILVGRLLCYGLLAIGLALITRRLELRLSAALTAVSLWLGLGRLVPMVPIESAARVYFGFAGVAIAALLLVCTGRFPNLKRHYLKLFLLAYGLLLAANDPQSVITGERLLPDFGAASIAYSGVIIAIGLLLYDRRTLAAVVVGFATSCHPLLGSYGAWVLFSCWLLEDIFLGTLRTNHTWKLFLPFAIGAIGAWPRLWSTVSAAAPVSEVRASEVIAFLRFPDHLNPAMWPLNGWLKLATYLVVLALSVYTMAVIQRRADQQIDRSFAKRRSLLVVFVCAVPFVGGWLMGSDAWWQYSPFSLLNSLLPLFTLLFFVRALQSICTLGVAFNGINGLYWLLTVPILLRTSFDLVPVLGHPANALTANLPTPERELYAWIQAETPPDATIVAPPDLRGIQFVAERGAIVSFEWLPPTASGVVEWLTRLDDLTAGGAQRELERIRTKAPRRIDQVRGDLVAAYQQLDAEQIAAIAERYAAACVVTLINAPIDAPIDATPIDPPINSPWARPADEDADYTNAAYAVYCNDRAPENSETTQGTHPSAAVRSK